MSQGLRRLRARDGGDDERGATIVVVALVLTISVFAASFAVDIGRLMVRRADAQSAVDLAVLGAVLHLPQGTTAASQAASDLVRANLGVTAPTAHWNAAWALGACTDGARLAIRGTVGGQPTDCISFDGQGGIRVKVPDQVLATSFARVMGITEMRTGAVAVARFGASGSAGAVLPFVALAGTPSGSLFCLRSASGGQASPPCQGSASGNFGPLEVPQHGNTALGTEVVPCNLNKSDQLAVNLSTGLDHVVLPFNGSEVPDGCHRPFAPKSLELFQGISNGLWEGTVEGVTVGGRTFPGRLVTSSAPTRVVRHGGVDRTVDNRPLWDCIGPGKGTAVPAGCRREDYPATVGGTGWATADAQLAACLAAYAAAPAGTYPVLFDADSDGDSLADLPFSRRFAFLPQSTEASFPSGNSANVRVAAFRAVFVNGLYFGCTGGGNCSTVFVPGESTALIQAPNGNHPLDQVTGYLLPESALPPGLAANGVNGSLGVYRPQLAR